MIPGKIEDGPDTKDTGPVTSRVSLFKMPLDINVDNQEVIRRMSSGSLLLSYLNPYAYKIAELIPTYPGLLERFDLVVCDGLGIQLAAKSVFSANTPILTPDFSGIGRDYLQFADRRQMTMCLVGAQQEIVQAAVSRLSQEYPGLAEISGYSGFGESLTEAREYILTALPDMVLVGMGMGIQEKYLLDLADSGWSGIGICVGGFFDKLANPQLEYPAWSEKMRLRFLARLLQEPRRLSKRYFVDYQPFIKMYIMHVSKGHS